MPKILTTWFMDDPFGQFLAFLQLGQILRKFLHRDFKLEILCKFLQLILKDVLKFKFITGRDKSKFCSLKLSREL